MEKRLSDRYPTREQLYAYEVEARRLRAEAMRQLAREARAWFASFARVVRTKEMKHA
jgi:hypothetical protein